MFVKTYNNYSFLRTNRYVIYSAQHTCLIIIPTHLNIHCLAYTYKKQCDPVFKVILLRNKEWLKSPLVR